MDGENLNEEIDDYFKDDEGCVTFDELNSQDEEYINHEDNLFNDTESNDFINFCSEESEKNSDDFNESGINKVSVSYDYSKYRKENLERYYVYLNRFLKDNGFTVTYDMSFWYGNFDFRISEKRVMPEGKKKKTVRLDFITIKDFFEKNGLNVEAVSKSEKRFRRTICSTENEYFVSVRLNSPFFEKYDSEILYEEISSSGIKGKELNKTKILCCFIFFFIVFTIPVIFEEKDKKPSKKIEYKGEVSSLNDKYSDYLANKTLYDVTVETKDGTHKFSNAEVDSYAEIIQVMVYDQDNKISEIIEFSKDEIKYVKKTVNDEKKENGKWKL